MQYRLLGRTGVYVSEFGLGANMFGGSSARWKAMGGLDQSRANELVARATDSGVNLFDTSNIYGEGESEVILGEALRHAGSAGAAAIVANKVSLRTGPGPNDVGASRLHLTVALELSLKRLKRDHVDLYQIHNFDPLTPIEETLRALDDLVRHGKVRYLGCSNFAAWQLMKALGVSEREHLSRFQAVQANYTLAAREIEREIIPLLDDQDVGLITWGPLMGGLLTGKYGRNGEVAAAAGGRLGDGANAWGDRDLAFDAVDAMRPIAESRGSTIGQVALAWLLAKPCVTSVLIGASRPEQLMDNLAAADITLSDDETAALNRVAPPRSEYPMSLQTALLTGRPPGGPMP